MYDIIVVGAGFAGSIAARSLAEAGKKVLILEQRSHIGGNAYDEYNEAGILVQIYGPHIYHTNSKRAHEYLSRFTEWTDYRHEVVGKVHGQEIPVPFNLNTLEQVYGKEEAEKREKKLLDTFGYGSKVPILKLREHPDEDIREIADYVYENIFLHYTMKQWGQTPEQIDPAVTGRVPVVLSRDNRYFTDTWQGMPKDGFTAIFEHMLDHENITVKLNCPAEEMLSFTEDGKIIIRKDGEAFLGQVIYTGPIDELFDCCYGPLPYRTLRFEWETLNQEEFQSHAVVNYTVDEDFTRITEFKKLTGQQSPVTTIIREYPESYERGKGQIPYYSISGEANKKLYEKYVSLAERYSGLHLLGRLAEYQYYNMDAITEKALELADELKNKKIK